MHARFSPSKSRSAGGRRVSSAPLPRGAPNACCQHDDPTSRTQIDYYSCVHINREALSRRISAEARESHASLAVVLKWYFKKYQVCTTTLFVCVVVQYKYRFQDTAQNEVEISHIEHLQNSVRTPNTISSLVAQQQCFAGGATGPYKQSGP